MCNVYNPVGSLEFIKARLKEGNANILNSLDEILEFKKGYFLIREKAIKESEISVENERSILAFEISELDKSITDKKKELEESLNLTIEDLKSKLNRLSLTSNKLLDTFDYNFRKSYLKLKIYVNDLSVNPRVSYSVSRSVKLLRKKDSRYQYILNHFSDAVNDLCATHLDKLDRTKKIIDSLDSHLYGAIGEQKVVTELEKLSDEHFLINDFCISFSKAIYNRNKKDYIKSIQIDHILVSPAGIFLIETKNWSDESIKSLSLRSPVDQITRTNFALYRILSDATGHSLRFVNHHWGERRIPIRNTIVMIRNKPVGEFKFVKVVTLPQLINYIEYFEPVFTSQETRNIANYLVKLSHKRI